METPIEAPAVQEHRLSPQQQRLWRLQQDLGVLFSQLALRIDGALRRALLVNALEELVARHEILRTVFRRRAGASLPVQVIHDAATPRVEDLDLRHLGPAAQGSRVAELLAGHRRREADLEAAPVLACSLIRLADLRHLLLVSLPSVCADARTLRNLVAQLAASYERQARGGGEDAAPEPMQYLQFSEWQLQLLAEHDGTGEGPAWPQVPADALPFKSVDGPALPAGEAAASELVLTAEETAAVGRLAASCGVSRSTVLLAGWQTLLGRLTDGGESVVAVAFEGRKYRELDDSFGPFHRWLPVRLEADRTTRFEEVLARLQDALEEAESWQEYFLPGDGGVAPAGFLFQEWPAEQVAGGLTFAVEELRLEDEPFLLLLSCRERHGRLELSLRVPPADPAPAAYLAARYRSLLGHALERPETPLGALDLLGAVERQRLLAEWGRNPAAPAGVEPLPQVFHRWAACALQATAVVAEGEHLSYGELERLAGRLAGALRRRGLEPEQRVGVALERSPGLVVSLLAVLEAGGAYVPLDPVLPQERLDFLCADALGEAALVITEERLAERFPGCSAVPVDGAGSVADAVPSAASGPLLDADCLAYVLYTSGSTGRPKGVGVSHANVVRLFTATAGPFGFDAADVWTLFHSYAFDLSVWEMWGAFLYGGRLVVVPHRVSRSPDAFHALLVRERVTVLTQTPSAFGQFIAADQAGAAAEELALRLVIFAGEALNLAALAPWLARHGDASPRLVNMYGITETTIHSTLYDVRRADFDDLERSPIGRQVADTHLYLLAASLQPVPVGAAGEIYVGGPGLARGYLGRPALTAVRFLPDPFSGEVGARLYRSGDLARYLADGKLEFIGRADRQVKVRGFRVELGEVEVALCRLPEVREAVAELYREESSEATLVACIVPHRGLALPSAAELRAELLRSLPEPMVPSVFVPLAALPLTANGKVDRAALRSHVAAGRLAPTTTYVAPETELERTLAAIWKDVLRVERVGRYDNFLDLGGHSVLMVQVFSRVKAQLETELQMVELFEFPTVSSMARRLAEEHEQAARPQLTAGRAEARLESLQQRQDEDTPAERSDLRRRLGNV